MQFKNLNNYYRSYCVLGTEETSWDRTPTFSSTIHMHISISNNIAVSELSITQANSNKYVHTFVHQSTVIIIPSIFVGNSERNLIFHCAACILKDTHPRNILLLGTKRFHVIAVKYNIYTRQNVMRNVPRAFSDQFTPASLFSSEPNRQEK